MKCFRCLTAVAWKSFGFILVLSALASTASADVVPEIDGSTIGTAIPLLVGGLAMIASRRKK